MAEDYGDDSWRRGQTQRLDPSARGGNDFSPEHPALPVRHSGRRPMQSTVMLRRIDPWSTFTVSLATAFALFLVWMVAVGMLYLLLSGMGVWNRLNGALSDVVAGSSSDTAVSALDIFTYAGGVGLLNVLLLSVFATLLAFVYNSVASILGGIQVTLADRGGEN